MQLAALIGCGRISHKHIEGFINNADRAILVATCDLIVERAEKRADEYRQTMSTVVKRPKVYADYKQMLAEQRPDIVTIATESGYHAKIAIECLSLIHI